MRAQGVKCTTLQVQIKDPNFRVIQRQKKLDKPTYISREIHNAAMEIIRESWNLKLPIRMITVTGSNLIKEDEINEQMSLFDENDGRREKAERLERTLDDIKNKFGRDVFTISEKREEKDNET